MDRDNPVVKLCIEGQRAEAQGRKEDALGCYLQAWKTRKNDLDACIAAHFVAKQQKDIKKTLKWNLLALKAADKVGGESVTNFYPSLYVNVADSYEKSGNTKKAKQYYDLAAATASEESLGSFGILLRESIEKGQRRTS